jgi:hypothetical protein
MTWAFRKGASYEPCIGAYSSDTMYLSTGLQNGISAEHTDVHEKMELKVSPSSRGLVLLQGIPPYFLACVTIYVP